MPRYVFQNWFDGPTTPTRLINISENMDVEAFYREVTNVATATFMGNISPVTAGPRTVTISVTLPGGATETLPAIITDAQGNYAASKQYAPGNYSAIASVPADSQNKAGVSPSVTFTIGLADTTVTLNVTVT